MTIELTCPSCQRRLRVPDELLGKTVRCPSCQSTFTATASESAPPPSSPWTAPEEPAGGRINIRGEIDRGEPPPPRPAPRERGWDEDEHDDRGPGRRGRDDYDEDHPYRDGRSDALTQVSGPAIALIVVGVIGILLGLVYIGIGVVGAIITATSPSGPGGPNNTDSIIAVVLYGGMGIFIALYNAVITYGAVKMKNLKSFGLAMTASILALIPCGSCWLLGIPFGIWALVVLSRPDVKSAFR